MRHTVETKRKLSKLRRGKNNPFWGQKHSAKTRRYLAKLLRSYNKNRTYDINPRKVKLPIKMKLSYIVALVDGEGSIGIRNHKKSKKIEKRPFVAIYNTDLLLKRWLQKETGIVCRPHGSRRERVQCWSWSVSAALDVYFVCKKLLPFLIIKQARAVKVMNFLRLKYGKRVQDG